MNIDARPKVEKHRHETVREYVSLERELTRLEARSPQRSAELRLQLTRARAAYLRSGEKAEAAYADTISLLGAACASALLELEADPGLARPGEPSSKR